ncbi:MULTISPECIES: EspA/EspE family type VII secretion system effector [unclassified Mycobacterium]|uniref:EspA/EspE family type VII secretion system effector n=1 Tax=unclassified Mycobacterium TaxID=2642494 RepID=UPI0029C985DF|nr:MULTISPECIES: EspA/EspE family type VII secretion system effector [unclassified Mycobacterium]
MSLLGEALELLKRYGEVLGGDGAKGPSLLDRIPPDITDFATSPILLAAQLTIKGMRGTVGSGDPEDGEAFKKSAKLYDEAAQLLIDASVADDQWDGTAADAYDAKNDTHRHLTFEVASAENDLRGHLGELAAQVTETRGTLDGAFGFLSDFDTATSWMNAVPGGALAKAIADTGAAASQLSRSELAMSKLLGTSLLNAHRIRETITTYQAAAAQQLLDSDRERPFPCGEPFGDERTNGQLPQRVDPKTNGQFELPEPPPIEHPPATPYGTPAPR